MCGIAGIWDRRAGQGRRLADEVSAMSAAIAHRGPDDAGSFVDPAAGIALGHRRLAVVDLSAAGHQPMASADGRFVVTYNGELYNFGDLRHELQGAGRRFAGSSDTEVLVAGFERWGVRRTLERANGMFALAVWDGRDRVLHLARDRFGEKPLYYGWCGPVLLFGSELKALRAHPAFRAELDRDALGLYFRHNCVPGTRSIYAGVSKLPPGTLLSLREDGDATRARPEPFWSLGDIAARGVAERLTGGIDESADALEEALSGAVRARMYADVPMGAFLSGGIDSSLVVALMQAQSAGKVRTFTIAFDDLAFDEGAHAAAVATHLGTDHTELVVTSAEAQAVIPTLPAMYDEPFADSSQIPQAVLAGLTRRHVTVAMAGDGGDELFAGYNRYAFAEQWWPRLGALPRPVRRAAAALLAGVTVEAWDRAFARAAPVLPSRLRVRMPGTKLHKVARVLPAGGLDEVHRLLASHADDPQLLVPGALDPGWPPAGTARPPSLQGVEGMQYLDALTYLPDDILTKVDRATMAVALEVRLPFLDPEVAALSWRIPIEHKLRHGSGKLVLRRLLHRYVPAALVERPKAGFGVPLADWLRGPLRPWAEDLLGASLLARQGYLAVDPVRRMWAEHTDGRRDWAYELWDVLMFQAWLAAWLPSEG